MALRPKMIYSGQTVTTDRDYPHGKARNDLTPGDNTGTPLEAKLVNEIFGFQQALLALALLTPSNVAETATVSQYADSVVRIARSVNGRFNPLSYGASGNDTTDDTAAINATLAAAAAANATVNAAPTTVDLAGRFYRVTAALSIPPHVNVKNGGLSLDHATANLLSFTTSNSSSAVAVWENVWIEALQPNSGTIIDNPSATVSVVFRDCLVNQTGNFRGKALLSAVASTFKFTDCLAFIPVGGNGFEANLGRLVIRGGRLVAPATYAHSVVTGTGGTHVIDNVEFDMSAAANSAICYELTGAKAKLTGNTFIGNGSAGIAIKSALAANAGVLNESASRFDGAILPYSFANNLALGSSVGGAPHQQVSAAAAGVTIPSWARSWSQRMTTASTTPVNATFDPPICAGQEMDFVLGNDHTASWSGNIVFTGVKYDLTSVALSNLSNNSALLFTAHLRAVIYETALIWVMSGMTQVAN